MFERVHIPLHLIFDHLAVISDFAMLLMRAKRTRNYSDTMKQFTCVLKVILFISVVFTNLVLQQCTRVGPWLWHRRHEGPVQVHGCYSNTLVWFLFELSNEGLTSHNFPGQSLVENFKTLVLPIKSHSLVLISHICTLLTEDELPLNKWSES